MLVDRGYQEAITYSFVDPRLQRLMFPKQAALALENPLSAELGEMRVSLWPGLLEVLRFNLRRQQDRVRIFEVGTRFEVDGRTASLKARPSPDSSPGPLFRSSGAVETSDGFLRHRIGRRGALRVDRPPGRNKSCRCTARLPAPGPKCSDLRSQSARWLDWPVAAGGCARSSNSANRRGIFELAIDPSFRSEVPVFSEISKVPCNSARPRHRRRRVGDAGRSAGKC